MLYLYFVIDCILFILSGVLPEINEKWLKWGIIVFVIALILAIYICFIISGGAFI